MRSKLFFLVSAFGALTLVTATASPAEACCFCCWGKSRAPAYYYAPAPLPPPIVNVVKVTAKDDVFDPLALTIKAGTTVEWVNDGKRIHTVTSDDGKFDSGDIPHGGVFRATFVTPGTYRYHCKHHKGMVGTITVEAPK